MIVSKKSLRIDLTVTSVGNIELKIINQFSIMVTAMNMEITEESGHTSQKTVAPIPDLGGLQCFFK